MKTLATAWFMTLATFLPTILTSQNLDHLMVKRQMECSDVSLNCTMLFVDYYKAGKLDSAVMIIDYWQNKCGLRDPIMRAKMLVDLKTGKFSEWFVGNSLFDFINMCIFRYNSPFLDASNSFENNRADFAFVPPQGEYDLAVSQLAEELREYYPSESYERAWVEFLILPTRDIYLLTQTEGHKGTSFAMTYNSKLRATLKQPEFHMSLIGGMWVPTGELTALGMHPSLGMQVGTHSQKNNWDLTMSFKFNNTPRPYYAYPYDYSTEKVATTYFFGGYIGIDWGRCLVRNPKDDFLLLAGFGYDGFDVNNLSYYDPAASSVSSYNFNLGFGYHFYYNNNAYLGLQVKYNIIDYTLNNVIDLGGDALTINLVWGASYNVPRTKELENLGYYGR